MLDSRAGRSQGREAEEMGAVCSPVGDMISDTVGMFSGASDKRIRMGHLHSDRQAETLHQCVQTQSIVGSLT